MRRPGARAPDLSEVQAFVAAARAGSLAKAAAELGISTPAVAKRLRNLEAAADTTLLERSTRGVRLTPAGRAVYDGAMALLASAAELFDPINGGSPRTDLPRRASPPAASRARARELALVADLALEAADATDAGELLRRVVALVDGALAVAAVAVFELDPGAGRLCLAAASGPLETHVGSLALESVGPDATMLTAVFDDPVLRALGLGRPLTSVIDGAERPHGVLALYGGPPAADAHDRAVVLDVMASVVGDALRRIALEAALRERESTLTAFFEAAADPMLIVDDDRNFTDVNAAALELLGYDRQELLRLRIDDLLPPEDQSQVDAAWSAFRELGIVRAAGVLRCANGSYRAGDIHSRADFTPGRHLTVWRMTPP
jgi:PAS domain S-box-containing protein